MSQPVGPFGRKYASAFSTKLDLRSSIDEACENVLSSLGAAADFAVVFVSHAYAQAWDELPSELSRRLKTDRIIGCSGAGIIGVNREIEEGPALSIWAAHLPDVKVTPFRLTFQRTGEGSTIVGWPDQLVDDWPDNATLLLLADPFSFPADYLLQQMGEKRPAAHIIGGMASGGSAPGQNRLFIGRQSFESGAIACMIQGAVAVSSIVSQGCRPIGEKFVVTAAERNLIHQLGGKPAFEQLQNVFHQLPTREQKLVQQGLHIGRVVSEYQDEFEMGDFLVRNVLGIDHESGVIAVGDYIRPGQTVQFHLREEATATGELQQLLARHAERLTARAALLFTCNGRGSHLFSEPNHDATMVSQQMGDIPLAGFFAQGEIGPVGGISFLHGFTASLAFFT